MWNAAMGNGNHAEAAVVIIGGGISGMCAAIELLRTQTTQDIIILEKGTDFGGTWQDNRFPGSCCDVWGYLYCYSFEQSAAWKNAYPAQEEILQYLLGVARKYGLHKYVRFNTVVDGAVWDRKTQKWNTTVRVTGGKESEHGASYVITSDFLVSAVGQLSTPKYPKITGLDSFEGKVMHSARWDWSYRLNGKKVAVIGTGASAAQIIPEVAKIAEHLTVVQRSPGWVLPRHDHPIAPWKTLTLTYCPPVLRWYRASMMKIRESFYYAVTQADSHYAAGMRHANQTLMKQQLPNRPDLWNLLTPQYSPGCKRSIISDDYYPTLIRPNVNLESRPIERVTPEGILFEGQATETKLDLIVLATGFRSLDFLYPMDFVGLHGRPLSKIWNGIPQAHKGVTVEDLPNFGMLYGPNTNLSHNSLILISEAQSRYLNVLIKEVLDSKARGKTLALITKPDRLKAYNKKLQAALQEMSFADPGCSSWWKTESGVITNNWLGTAIDYQKLLSTVDWTDFDAEGSGASMFKSKEKERVYIGRIREESFFNLKTIVSSAILFAALLVAFYSKGWTFFK